MQTPSLKLFIEATTINSYIISYKRTKIRKPSPSIIRNRSRSIMMSSQACRLSSDEAAVLVTQCYCSDGSSLDPESVCFFALIADYFCLTDVVDRFNKLVNMFSRLLYFSRTSLYGIYWNGKWPGKIWKIVYVVYCVFYLTIRN